MGQVHVVKKIVIDAPIARVFERLLDHEAMCDWPGVGSCELVREGTPRGGVGAVRKVTASGLSLLEEVVHYEALVGYDYKITKGLPLEHLGQVRLCETASGVELRWEVRMSSRWPFVCGLVGSQLSKGLDEVLPWFKRAVEAAPDPA